MNYRVDLNVLSLCKAPDNKYARDGEDSTRHH